MQHVTFSIRDDTLALLDKEAVACRWSRSKTVSLIVESYLYGQELAGTLKQAGEVEEGGGRCATNPDTRTPVAPSSTSSRKKTCPHRVPPDSYCGRCDG